MKTFVGNTFAKDGSELDPRKTYKYLGIEKSQDVQHKNKEKLKKEYLWRLSLVLDAELSAKNNVQANGSLEKSH